MFDAIFGTPNKDKANAQQANLMHNQLALGNQLHNKGTTGKIMQELSIRNYGRQISNQRRRVNQAQSKVFKTAESLARIRATAGKVNEGGRSTRFADNQGAMLLSKLSSAENFLRYSSGEQASLAKSAALNKYQSDYSRANEAIGVGIGAKRGITYTKDNNALKFANLAISVATGDFGGAFGQLESGGNASMLQWMGNQSTTKGWTGLGG